MTHELRPRTSTIEKALVAVAAVLALDACKREVECKCAPSSLRSQVSGVIREGNHFYIRGRSADSFWVAEADLAENGQMVLASNAFGVIQRVELTGSLLGVHLKSSSCELGDFRCHNQPIVEVTTACSCP